MQNYNGMFPHIAGYEKIKEEGAQIIDILSRVEEYIKRGAYVPRGWFFYGEPGMGKTQLVKDISKYLNYPIIEISSSDAIRRKVAINEDIVLGFKDATKKKKCIIFIDEMDKFAGYKKYSYEITSNLDTQKVLLHELDVIKKYDGVVVIATANKPELLNDTILRCGRFDRQVLFPSPSAKDRKEIFNLFIGNSKLSIDVDIDELVKITAGCSCAEIESITNEAKISSISKRNEEISLNDFLYAYNRVKYKDIPKDEIDNQEQSLLVAYHEAGHAFMAYMLNPEMIHNITIIPQGQTLGSVKYKGDDDLVKTKEYFENLVKISLAGMLSVKVITGTLSSGNNLDLEKAVSQIRKMMDNGFYGFENIDIQFYPEIAYPVLDLQDHNKKRCNTIKEILCELSKDVEEHLIKNKDLLLKISKELLDRKNLSKKELVEIIKNN